MRRTGWSRSSLGFLQSEPHSSWPLEAYRRQQTSCLMRSRNRRCFSPPFHSGEIAVLPWWAHRGRLSQSSRLQRRGIMANTLPAVIRSGECRSPRPGVAGYVWRPTTYLPGVLWKHHGSGSGASAAERLSGEFFASDLARPLPTAGICRRGRRRRSKGPPQTGRQREDPCLPARGCVCHRHLTSSAWSMTCFPDVSRWRETYHMSDLLTNPPCHNGARINLHDLQGPAPSFCSAASRGVSICKI